MRSLGDRIFVSLMMGGLLAVFVLVIALAKAHAHDHSRPDLDNWFHNLHSKGHAWCCEGPGRDALHLNDADWETEDGHYRVKIPVDSDAFERALKGEQVDTMWSDVDDDAVIEEPNKDGPTMVWPTYGYMGPRVRCFMPGSMT